MRSNTISATDDQLSLFPSRYEEGFLSRTLGDILRVPETALTELVANAWDAGASRVEVHLPTDPEDEIYVEDDGTGLTKEQFAQRWMTLGYNRQRRQGSDVEFPEERQGAARKAYGRNGLGRHSMLCFNDDYFVSTWRDGFEHRYRISPSSGNEAFRCKPLETVPKPGHGTRVSAVANFHRPDPDHIREVLASKFLYDPDFVVSVNGISLPLVELPGFTETISIEVADPDSDRYVKIDALVVDGEAGRTKHQSGVAFWIGGRLVGKPGWIIGDETIIDGRTRPGRSLTIIVRSADLFNETLPDWSGFRRSALVTAVYTAVAKVVRDVLNKFMSSRIKDTNDEVVSENRVIINSLSPGERLEVIDIVQGITKTNPLLSASVVSATVKEVVESKRRTSPEALVQRILELPLEDVEGLHRLLDEWSVRDALFVLDEIGRRIKAVESLQKLMDDKKIDEVHTIHPLVLKCRWLFGPEYESPLFASNVTIQTVIKKIFKEDLESGRFTNHRKRPDIVIKPDSTMSALATEKADIDGGPFSLDRILLLELKKGGYKVGQAEMVQAYGYVNSILSCGICSTQPYITAFVVGYELDQLTQTVMTVGSPEKGRITAVSLAQLIQTANVRLFRIRDSIDERYPESAAEVVDALRQERLLDEPPP